jgi:hypothetical protein
MRITTNAVSIHSCTVVTSAIFQAGLVVKRIVVASVDAKIILAVDIVIEHNKY